MLNNIQTKERKKEDLSGLDFMKLRDRLSNILKTEKKIEAMDELSTSGKMKAFTKSFFRYITDRNIYTHGELSLDIAGSQFIIHVKVEGKEDYYKIDRIILESHLICSKELQNNLGRLDIYYRDKK